MENNQRYQQMCDYFPGELGRLLHKLPYFIRSDLHEIRVRANRPIALMTAKQCWFLQKDGQPVKQPSSNCWIFSTRQIETLFKSFCEYSVHSFQNEIVNGYITIVGGHRIGICGTVLTEAGKVIGIREISSLNIRIAREVRGAADEIFSRVLGGKLQSILIAGVPASGKTTLIREIARGISDGRLGRFYKVAMIDERGELAAIYQGAPQNEVGISTDVYHLCPKAIGMELALRTGAPDIIFCDEIGQSDDANMLIRSMLAGVKVIATAHADSISTLMKREQIQYLCKQQIFDKIVLLKQEDTPCEIDKIVQVEQLFHTREKVTS